MSDQVEVFFQWLTQALMDGDLDQLTNTYVYPLSLFVNGTIRVERTPQETRNYLSERRRDAAAIGVTHIHCDVLEIGTTRNGRFPVRVRQSFRDAKGEELTHNIAKFLCVQDERETIFIESVEIQRLGLPFGPSQLMPFSN